VCAQTAPPEDARRSGPRITPIQWIGLGALVLLFLQQAGILQLGSGLGAGSIQSKLPTWVALVVGITFHEFSHGLVATWFGDDVPRRAGRLTLNPLKHLDPLGTLMILVAPIGWGRPMPINPAGMRNPNLGWALSSAAGPISNVLVATIVVVVAAFANINPLRDPWVGALISLNLGLAVFNLVPLPPLDGFGFVFGLAPRPVKAALAPLWQFGPFLLLGLLFLPEILPGFPPILNNALSEGIAFLGSLLIELYRAIQ
jgi:Zn-dependent protease